MKVIIRFIRTKKKKLKLLFHQQIRPTTASMNSASGVFSSVIADKGSLNPMSSSSMFMSFVRELGLSLFNTTSRDFVFSVWGSWSITILDNKAVATSLTSFSVFLDISSLCKM